MSPGEWFSYGISKTVAQNLLMNYGDTLPFDIILIPPTPSDDNWPVITPLTDWHPDWKTFEISADLQWDFNHRLATKLSNHFNAECLNHLGAEVMKEVNEVNKRIPNCCATGDFCDSNMLMDAAFKKTFGHGPNINADFDNWLWNTAWSLSKKHEFQNI